MLFSSKYTTTLFVFVLCASLLCDDRSFAQGDAAARAATEKAVAEAVKAATDAGAKALADDAQDEMDEDVDVIELQAAQLAMNPFGEMGEILGAKQFSLNQFFAIELDRIDSICKLSDDQKTKLKIGVKGVVKKIIDQFRIEASFMRLGIQSEQQNNDDAEEVEIKEITNVNDVDEMVWQMVEMGDSPAEYFEKNTKNHPMWKKIIDSTLSESQRKTYSDAIAAQNKARAESAIAFSMMSIQNELNLTDAQTEQLKDLVEKNPFNVRELPFLYENFSCHLAIAGIEPKVLESVLNEAQSNRLQVLMMPFRSMREEMDGVDEAPLDEAFNEVEDDKN